MSEAKTITRVVYRTYPAGDVVALLLDCEANLGRVVCYQHIGQHGEGVYFGIMGGTRPATEDEIRPLRDELIRIGYAPIFRKRRTTRAGTKLHVRKAAARAH